MYRHDTARIEVFTGQDDSAWVLRTYGRGEGAALPGIGVLLDVSEVDANVFGGRGLVGDAYSGPPR